LIVLAVTMLAAALLAPAAFAQDYANIARDIVPSGQYGSAAPPPQATQQAQMYNALTPLFNHVTASDLVSDFKPEQLGIAGAPGPVTTETVTQPGVTLYRDAYDVPYIYGTTRDDVTWGSGWVTAEDRGLLLQEARYIALLPAVDAPGQNAIGLIGSVASFTPSAQTEREVAKQTGGLLAAGAEGRAILHDIDVYVAGINGYLNAHNHTLGIYTNVPDFTRTDVYAFNAVKDQFVGQGGGNQAINAEFLSSLQRRMGAARGYTVWNDLRQAYDQEAPASVPGHISFQPKPTSTDGNVLLDPGSLSPAASAALTVQHQARRHASNALLVSGARSATHHPIMVAGPQIGYFYPGLTLEMDLEGPGIHQRGVSTAPFPGYIFIGRSQDQGWSLTSAGLDQIDTYVETLCGHSIHRYMFDGKCRAMTFFDAGKLTTKKGTTEVAFYRTDHGSVFGYARVHGRLVALTHRRASYGKDVLDLLFYYRLAHGQVHNVHQFFKAASLTPQTFNSLYMDDKDIGVFTSGLVPIRPANVDQDLPISGTGKEEWRGFVSFKNHPQGIDPANGEIVNWNNRPQTGYQAPDDNWSLGAIHRVDLLLNNLGHGGGLTPERVVSAMNEAATQDVREMTLEPLLSKLLHGGRAPSSRAATMLSLLDHWHAQGGSRLDRTGNGQITAPGAAIMDTAWPLLAKAWASSVLGQGLSAQLASFVSVYDQPNNGMGTGGQETGWHSWIDKDLRTILGQRVKGPFAVRYCGAGSLQSCRSLLWGAIDQAGNQLAARQGADPANWHSSAIAEQISFVPGLLPYKMAYTNRPTGIQQILSFSGHAPGDG
jgi:acyl-homoserine lactone acylase PvdQ